MKAMILAAGFGTRLRPLTEERPKPLFPVMNRSLLGHWVDQLQSFGADDIVVNVHHLQNHILDAFDPKHWQGSRLHFSREKEILGTAGGIKKAQPFLDGGPFIVANSDILADIDFDRVIAFHKQKGSCLTLVVRQDEFPERYDPIEINSEGRIVNFLGTTFGQIPTNSKRVMFTGIQIMEPEIFFRIPPNSFSGTTEDIFPKMVAQGLPVYGFLHDKYWIDTGNRESYLQVHQDAMDHKISLSSAARPLAKGPGRTLPVSIGENCVIAADAHIGPYTVLGEGCRIDAGAVVERSVCWDGVVVEKGATVSDSILGSDVVVPEDTRISEKIIRTSEG
jgi:NDP-sugar pyrophosphorylase family protein